MPIRNIQQKIIGAFQILNKLSGYFTQEDEDILADITTEDLKKFGLIPELIGRFPLVTHVKNLTEDELYKVLIEPKNSIIKQYQKMMWMDNIDLTFEEDALNVALMIV